jgi:hypothetical protein
MDFDARPRHGGVWLEDSNDAVRICDGGVSL